MISLTLEEADVLWIAERLMSRARGYHRKAEDAVKKGRHPGLIRKILKEVDNSNRLAVALMGSLATQPAGDKPVEYGYDERYSLIDQGAMETIFGPRHKG